MALGTVGALTVPRAQHLSTLMHTKTQSGGVWGGGRLTRRTCKRRRSPASTPAPTQMLSCAAAGNPYYMFGRGRVQHTAAQPAPHLLPPRRAMLQLAAWISRGTAA